MKYYIMVLLFTGLLLPVCSTANSSGFAESSDHVRIAYKTYGSGDPVLIINGGPGMNSEGFAGLATELSRMGFMAIIYDQRGTGHSTMNKVDSTSITMDLMIDDIEAIRKHLSLENWHILGHSFGGMLASLYASAHPVNIKKLILSSSGGIDLDLLSYVQKSINSKLTRQQADSISYYDDLISNGDTTHNTRLHRGLILAHAYVINPKFLPIVGERLTQGNAIINGLLWQNMRDTHFNCADGLRKFNKPVLIIQGKDDIVRKESAYKAKAVLPQASVVFLDHTIHYGWLDNKSVYLNTIKSFITG